MLTSTHLRLIQARPCVQPPTLDQAFRAYAPRLATLALRILGRRDEADDLVQDVFMKAGKWVFRLREPDALQAWLTKVTVRPAWRRLRLRRFRVTLGLEGSFDYAEVAGQGRVSPDPTTNTGHAYLVRGAAVKRSMGR